MSPRRLLNREADARSGQADSELGVAIADVEPFQRGEAAAVLQAKGKQQPLSA